MAYGYCLKCKLHGLKIPFFCDKNMTDSVHQELRIYSNCIDLDYDIIFKLYKPDNLKLVCLEESKTVT
jgi:hypothetical protein